MKLLNLIESLLELLVSGGGAGDWLEKHLSVFKALARILVCVTLISMHPLHDYAPVISQRLRFWCFSLCLSPLSRVWHRKRSQPRFSGVPTDVMVISISCRLCAARLAACCYFRGFPASERFPLTLPSLLRSRG
ncbi:hypothetical protein AAG927_025375 (plasmid) [Enterobacter hormaechei]